MLGDGGVSNCPLRKVLGYYTGLLVEEYNEKGGREINLRWDLSRINRGGQRPVAYALNVTWQGDELVIIKKVRIIRHRRKGGAIIKTYNELSPPRRTRRCRCSSWR